MSHISDISILLDKFNNCETTEQFLQFSSEYNVSDRESAEQFLSENKNIPFVIRECNYSNYHANIDNCNHVYCITKYDFASQGFKNFIIQSFPNLKYCAKSSANQHSVCYNLDELSTILDQKCGIEFRLEVLYYSDVENNLI